MTSKAALGEENWSFAFAPLFFALGIALPLLIFPNPASYVSIAVLTLGDGSASIFGKKFGRTVIPFNKSKKFEGSILGFFTAFLGTMFFVDPLRGLIAATVGMIVEFLPLPVNDNLSIPLLSGLAVIIMS